MAEFLIWLEIVIRLVVGESHIAVFMYGLESTVLVQ
jgi:hypothetical protein